MRPVPCVTLPFRSPVAVVVVGLALASPAAGQRIPEALSVMDPANAEAWIAPFSSALAPALTTGFFVSGDRTPSLQGDALGVGVRWIAGTTRSTDHRFRPVLPGSVSFDGVSYDDPYVLSGTGETSPTVAGSGQPLLLVPRPGSAFEEALDDAGVGGAGRVVALPDGLDRDRAPLGLVEVSLALRGLGLQLVGRFTPTVELFDDLGDVSAFGGGALLTVSRYFPVDLVDVGLSAVTQKVQAAGWLDGSASAFGVVVSKQVGPVRPYLHGTLASSTLEIRYRARNPEANPLLPSDGTEVRLTSEDDGTRGAAGLVTRLGPVGLTAEYQTGGRDVLSVRATLVGS